MNTSSKYNTDWPQSPGATILAIATSRGETLSALSEDLGPDFAAVIEDSSPISNELAQRLEERLGGSKGFWLRRDASFQEAKREPELEKESDWLKSLPYADIANLGWLPRVRKTDEKIENLYDFFGCDNLREWRAMYGATLDRVAFRTTFAFENDAGATLAWLRMGDILADSIKAETFSTETLRNNIDALRKECRKSSPELFLPNVERILADAGVKFVVARAPKGCRASGATRIIGSDVAIIQMSFRYLSDDHFWFTLFHEVGHLLLHRDNDMFLEGTFVEKNEIEEEANHFSAATLIPDSARDEIRNMVATRNNIIRMAFNIGVSPGILVGQMQHMGIIAPSSMNFLKRRFRWK
ncbi:ImmA/IrrE family metallo-endopeptidase [Limimaricola soesokkakensis]|uniref:ImmA/IrrE family metallo-endopeptidase n=1 Tax=Limimaricola soesokkakensis TaxID=1343159 RepID=UPI003514AC31